MPVNSDVSKKGVTLGITVEVPEAFRVSPKRGAATIAALQKTLMKNGRLLQREAVRNASGRSVTYKGQTFTIKRQTGNLVRNIHPPTEHPLSVSVVSDAKYAAAVEAGHEPIDLKKTMAGKIVPLPIKPGVAKSAQTFMESMGSTVYTKSDSFGNPVRTVEGLLVRTKYGSTGKPNGSVAVLFRRVPQTGSGWIIPRALPRPYMAAATETVLPLLTKDISETFIRSLVVP